MTGRCNIFYCRDELAVFDKVETKTIDKEILNNDGRGTTTKKKAILIIRLKRHENFQKKYEMMQKIRAENQRMADQL